jgi:hypothetical protein
MVMSLAFATQLRTEPPRGFPRNLRMGASNSGECLFFGGRFSRRILAESEE